MNLKEKLASLERTHTIKAPSSESARPVGDFSHLMPGEVYLTRAGPCWHLHRQYDFDTFHGSFRLREFLQNDPGLVPLMARQNGNEPVSLERLLFIDVETTGLSGGIGTVAFLVGLGHFAPEMFVIDQFFMRGFQEEPAILQTVLDRLNEIRRQNGVIVSFNGKSYDLPLLYNRAIFHRFLRTEPHLFHIDLLHSARRFWKKALPDCSLTTLEARLLHVRRSGDIPGSMIPEIYFRYLRSQDPRSMNPVFHHNQWDILSMVGLFHLMLQVYATGEHGTRVPVDWLAIGHTFEEAKRMEQALAYYYRVLNINLPANRKKEVLLRIARIHKRRREWDVAVSIWEQTLAMAGFDVEPYEELAKVYEHHRHDLHLARQYTLRALQNVQLLATLGGESTWAKEKQQLLWRLNRLQRKLQAKSNP